MEIIEQTIIFSDFVRAVHPQEVILNSFTRVFMLKDTPQFELETKQCTNLIDVLSVSPIEEDHVFFESVLSYFNWTLCPNTTWMVSRSSTGSAFAIELESGIPIVVCECDVFPGRWKKILEQIAPLRNPPLLIVSDPVP